MIYTLYNQLENGRIIQSGSSPVAEEYRLNANGDQIPGYKILEDVAGNPDTQRVENGVLVDWDAGLAAHFVLERDGALAQIDRQAEIIRGVFITVTPSQPAVYLAKEAEALAFMADQTINPNLTPNLAREAARTGISTFEVAQVILTKAHMWREISAVIEDRRLGAKDAVIAATTLAEIYEARDIDWSDLRDQA